MKLEIIKGVEGMSAYVNDYRIAGSKPWGGGTAIASWTINSKSDLEYIKKVVTAQLKQMLKAREAK